LSGKTDRQRGRGRAFDHSFFHLDEAQDGERYLFFVDEQHSIGVLTRDLECVASDLGNSETVGQRWAVSMRTGFPACNAAEKAGHVFRFHRNDARCGRKVLTARETPASRPPPPTGTMTASRFGTCATISRPAVPCPR
jgi:hypothetical protein